MSSSGIENLSDANFYELVQQMEEVYARRAGGYGFGPSTRTLETVGGQHFSLEDINNEWDRRREKFWVEVKKITVDVVDPPLPIYQITIWGKGGMWNKSFGSQEAVEAFLEGVAATALFTELGLVFVPPIPSPIAL